MDYIIAKNGDYGSVVETLQILLKKINLYDGKIDGGYGPITSNSVSVFQKSNNVPVTGKMDTKTYERLVYIKALFVDKPKISFDERFSDLPWKESKLLSEMNNYIGIVENSCYHFKNDKILIWESKFDIDADGSGPETKGDTFIGDTSLHDQSGKPLNSWRLPFAVLPLDRKGHIDASISETGLQLGDLGVAFYEDSVCPFIYGDRGPSSKIGEGSAYMAYNLGINYDPVRGGLQDIPPGVIFLSFIGSSNNKGKNTQYTIEEIWAKAYDMYKKYIPNERKISRNILPIIRELSYPDACE